MGDNGREGLKKTLREPTDSLKLSGEVSDLAKGVSQSASDAISDEFFLLILKHIRASFFSSESYNIQQFLGHFSDINFSNKVNEYIRQQFEGITGNSEKDSYEEISFLLFLLSCKADFHILSHGDIYDIDSLTKLFDLYISNLESCQTLDQVNSLVDFFVSLCGTLNIVFIINQNDNFRRDFVLKCAETLVSKIFEFLEKIPDFVGDDDKRNIGNQLIYYAGLFPLNVSHTRYISLYKVGENSQKEIDIKSFLREYNEVIDSIIIGYNLCKENQKENAEKNYPVFVGNLIYTLGLIVLKLSGEPNIEESNISKNEDFIKLASKIFSSIGIELDFKRFSFNSIKIICNSVLTSIYDGIFVEGGLGKDLYIDNSNEFLRKSLESRDFMSSEVKLETIHHLLLFGIDIENDILFGFLNILIGQNRSNNKAYEVFKLKIINIILTRLVNNGVRSELIPILEKIELYIDENKIGSQLLFLYSLDYATIGYCYSFFNDENYQRAALRNFAKFSEINLGDFDFYRYGINIEKFRLNVGEYGIKNSGLCDSCEVFEQCSFEGNGCRKHDNNSIMKFGEKSISNFVRDYNALSLSKSLNRLDDYLNSKITSKALNLSELSSEVSSALLSIFHGIADFKLIDIHEPDEKEVPSYKETKPDTLVNGYRLKITYPKNFRNLFDEIYSTNRVLIMAIEQKLKDFLDFFREGNKELIKKVREVEDALKNNRIEFVFQPITDQNGNVLKYEMLSRIRGIDGSLESIYSYVKALNEYDVVNNSNLGKGLLKDLLKRLLNRALDMLDENENLSFSINLEYSDLVDPELLQMLENIKIYGRLETSKDGEKSNVRIIDTSKITFELVEGKWEDDDKTLDILRSIKGLGYKLSMDDFGAGDSNINRVIDLLEAGLLDYLKIDGKIIEGLKDVKRSKTSRRTILYIVGLCEDAKIPTIAEYIEDKFLLETSAMLGVGYFQGYHFSRPLTLEQLREKYGH